MLILVVVERSMVVAETVEKVETLMMMVMQARMELLH